MSWRIYQDWVVLPSKAKNNLHFGRQSGFSFYVSQIHYVQKMCLKNNLNSVRFCKPNSENSENILYFPCIKILNFKF